MRKLVYYIAVSLDGCIADPDGSDPTSGPGAFWPIGEDYVRHIAAEYPETLPGPARDAFGISGEGTHFDTVLEGRRAYQNGVDAGIDNAYPHLRHLVFSRTLTEPAPDPAIEIISTDPVAKVRELKQEDGKDIWLCGGGALAGALYSEIDQLIVKLAPMTVGSGTPLFGQKTPFDPAFFTLTDSKILGSGTIFLTYAKKRDAKP
ncbi:dihydrofolate reductase family protein [Streptomyces sp. NBC_01511]|uniref:dihydrofolate reductase family protein n=1 Tax=Streptomyces sp. NBC_01511 TaxID=2903889 RepID=UPI0038694912